MLMSIYILRKYRQINADQIVLFSHLKKRKKAMFFNFFFLNKPTEVYFLDFKIL